MEKYEIGYTVNKKLKACASCGNPIAKSAKRCPHCGAKNKKPFYKRFWFWLLILLLLCSFINQGKDTQASVNSSEQSWQEASSPTWSTQISGESTAVQASTAPTRSEAAALTEAESIPSETTEALVNGMHPDFKTAMDSYEEFIDEYCEFMKKYAESPDDLGLLVDYAAYMAKLSDTMAKLEALDDSELNNEEMIYYVEVHSRITKKLLTVANEIG